MNSGRISNFDIQNLIILFWHSNLDRILNFDIRNPILTFEFGPNIEFWHSKYYWHSNSDRISNFDIQNPILTFKFGPNFEFCHSKSYFDIRIRTEYRILTFKILFWHSNLDRISNFDIQNLILTFELGPNIEFWHSKSYFDIRTWTEYRIFCFSFFVFRHSNSDRISLFDILNPIWHSNSGKISEFDIQNLILTFELGPNIEFWHSKSYFDIRIRAEYRILTF